MTDEKVLYVLDCDQGKYEVHVRPESLDLRVERENNFHHVVLKNVSTPENFHGLTLNISATEVKQELELLRARERDMREFPSRYYGEALDDVSDLLDRLLGASN